MPRKYMPPTGTPLFWEDDQTGALRDSMNAFFNTNPDSLELTQERFELVKDYLLYWVEAPLWTRWAKKARKENDLVRLTRMIMAATAKRDIEEWLVNGVTMGIDPIRGT